MSIPSANLDVRDLRLVLALVRTGTTKGAGGLLHLAQPSVSRALLALEDRIDIRLFERTPHGLVPTKAGAVIAERALDLLEEFCELDRTIREPSTPVPRIRIVCGCYTAYHWLPSVLVALRETQPNLEVHLDVAHTHSAESALEEGLIDAALLSAPGKPNRDFITRPLFFDEMLFVLAADHPLASKRRLEPDDLVETPIFTAPPTASEARWFMSAVFGRARPRLRVSTIPVTEAIVDLARAKMGIGIITEWVAGRYLKDRDLVTRRLRTGALKRPWHLAWRRDLGATGPLLLRALKRSAPSAGADV